MPLPTQPSPDRRQIALVVVELTHLVAAIVCAIYRAGVDLIIACLPRVPWLASSVRFADAALGYVSGAR